jgi:hypothetical protein
MKLFVKFKKEKWERFYGSFFEDSFIAHQNGDVYFSDDAILFSNEKYKASISYKDIVSVGKRKWNLGSSTQLWLKTAQGKIYYILVPNVDFYIKKILEYAPHVRQTKLKGRLLYAIARFVLYVSIGVFTFLLLSLNDIFISEGLLPKASWILISSIALFTVFLLFRIHRLSLSNQGIPKSKLMIIAIIIPIVGPLVGYYYLEKYDVD